MKNKLVKFFCVVAGIDSTDFQNLPPSDKIWITHIGVMLTFTFIVLFGITYLSFDYIGSVSGSIDTATNKFVFNEVERNFGTWFIGVSIALVVAFIVVLFDRAIYQSDWFIQPTYGDKSERNTYTSVLIFFIFFTFLCIAVVLYSTFSSGAFVDKLIDLYPVLSDQIFIRYTLTSLFVLLVTFIIALIITKNLSAKKETIIPEPPFIDKISRVVIRLIISFCVAYSLSIFLELRIYETNILSEISKAHVKENKKIYEQAEEQINYLDENIQEKQKTVNNALSVINSYTNNNDQGILDSLNEVDSNISDAQSNYNNNILNLENNRKTELEPLRVDLTNYGRKINQLDNEITDFKNRRTDELWGTDFSRQEGLSGQDGDGKRAKSSAGFSENLEDRRKRVNKLYIDTQESIKSIQKSYDLQKKSLANAHSERIKSLNKNKSILSNSSALNSTDREIAVDAAKKALDEAQKDLKQSQKEKETKIVEIKSEIKNNPEFSPLRAGPIERLKTLTNLKSDTKYGDTISDFAFWIKAFVIFLEVIPIITKIFFSPPSVYATKLKIDVLEKNNRLLEGYSESTESDFWNKRFKEEAAALAQMKKMRDRLKEINEINDEIVELKQSKDGLELYITLAQEIHDDILAYINKHGYVKKYSERSDKKSNT